MKHIRRRGRKGGERMKMRRLGIEEKGGNRYEVDQEERKGWKSKEGEEEAGE